MEMGVQPERVAKLSGIGCSSKKPAYFMNRSHSFNSVHGTHALRRHRRHARQSQSDCFCVSGDADTASIGIGQFVHLMRRNLPMITSSRDNGVYGSPKANSRATADLGSN